MCTDVIASLPWRGPPSVGGRNVCSKPRSAVCGVAFFGESNSTPLCYVLDYEQALQFLSSPSIPQDRLREAISKPLGDCFGANHALSAVNGSAPRNDTW